MGEKDLLQSKTTWGTVMMFVAMLAHQFGWDIGDTGPWVDALAGASGAVVALIGRIKAVRKITSVAGIPLPSKGSSSDPTNAAGA